MAPVDPSRGQVLGLLVQTPTLGETVAQGGPIGVVILLVGHKVRSPYEGMILGAFVGLGFQVLNYCNFGSSTEASGNVALHFRALMMKKKVS